jgi:hypothetical protein
MIIADAASRPIRMQQHFLINFFLSFARNFDYVSMRRNKPGRSLPIGGLWQNQALFISLKRQLAAGPDPV